jgi:hypothetical protein
MSKALAGWETWTALGVGLVAAVSMPADFYSSSVSEIVTVLGFLMAAFVPAMVLAATALRAGSFSIKKIKDLGGAIRRQIRMFGGLLLYALAACVVLIAGKIAGWRFPVPPIQHGPQIALYLSSAYLALVTFLIVFLILRFFAFIAGIESLLNLTIDIAEDEARTRDRQADVDADHELANYDTPAGYGTTIPS